MRSCVACRRSDAKQRLVRVVRGPDGSLHCDQSGRSPGRGAYLCPRQQCFDLAERKRRLDIALKGSIAADYGRLRAEFSNAAAKLAATLPKQSDSSRPRQDSDNKVSDSEPSEPQQDADIETRTEQHG